MNKQEAFDRAWHGIIKQGCASWDDEEEICKYNGPDGTHCAVGWLVDDPSVLTPVEGHAVRAATQVLRELGLPTKFLIELQRAHDLAAEGASNHFIPRFKGNMRKLAAEHELTVPE